MATDYQGHEPKSENWQLQFPDGSIVHREGQPSDFSSKGEAITVANQLASEWQTQIIVTPTH